MIEDFVRLCNGEEPHALATGVDGLRALEVALAAYQSAEVGQPVKV
jgi:predicted dehydrogenase